jgi:hypothetical protein
LWDSKAISYPLTGDYLLPDSYLEDVPLVFEALYKLSPELEEKGHYVDPMYVSPVWVTPEKSGDHGGVIPRSTFSPAYFNDHQTLVFSVISERYLQLFDPHNAGSDDKLRVTERYFQRNEHPSITREFLGKSIIVFGLS